MKNEAKSSGRAILITTESIAVKSLNGTAKNDADNETCWLRARARVFLEFIQDGNANCE